MKISAMDSATCLEISDSIKGLNFGDVIQGCHSQSPLLIRPYFDFPIEESSVAIKLVNKGGFVSPSYGYLISNVPITNVKSFEGYDNGSTTYIKDHFVFWNGTESNPVPIPARNISGGASCDYIWLDVQAGESDVGDSSNLTYRITFDYN